MEGNEIKEGAKMQIDCVKCKDKTKIQNPQSFILKNGRTAFKGSCSKCGKEYYWT